MFNALLKAAASRKDSTSYIYTLARCIRAPSQHAYRFVLFRCPESWDT